MRLIWTDAGYAALVNARNDGTNSVRCAQIAVGTGTRAAARSDTGLESETKRLATISGQAVDDNIIHVVYRDESADAYSINEIGLIADDGTLLARYAQSAVITQKAAGSTILLPIDAIFADVDTTQITFPSAEFVNPPWGENTQGVVPRATQAEAEAGTDNSRGMSPLRVFQAVKRLFRATGPGAGGGLDADLLDNQHGEHYQQSIKPRQLSSSDNLDNINAPGWYGWGSSVPANAPAGGFSAMLVVAVGNGGLRQIAWSDGNPARSYIRTNATEISFLGKRWIRDIDETGGVFTGRVLFGGDGRVEGEPSIAAAIGDSDSGLHYVGDGVWELWANSQVVARVTAFEGTGLVAYRGISLEGEPLRLKTADDSSHELRYDDDLDGPVLDGYAGAALAYRGTRRVIATSEGLSVDGTATIGGTDVLLMPTLGNAGASAYFKGPNNESALRFFRRGPGVYELQVGNDRHRVWTSGNDGAGSDVDAGYLEGQRGKHYLQRFEPRQLTSNDDLNSITEPGWYGWGDSVTPANRPPGVGGYGAMLVMRSAGNDVRQIVHGTGQPADIYERSNSGGSFGDWERQITTADEGPGRGFDADSVDEYQARDLLRLEEDARITGRVTFGNTAVVFDTFDDGNNVYFQGPSSGDNLATINRRGANDYVWEILAARAQNAARLGNQDPNFYLYRSQGRRLSSADDLNNITDPGWYYWADGGPKNTPSEASAAGYMQVIDGPGSDRAQIVFAPNQNRNVELIRHYSFSGWRAWERVITDHDASSTDAKGLAERATDAEAADRSDNERYTTPAHLDGLRRQILDSTYPVGKVEWFDGNANPADAFGMPWSTWQRYAQGQTMVSEGRSPDGDYKSGGTKGGQSRVSLSADQNGPHKHGMFYNADSSTGPSGGLDVTASTGRNDTGDRDYAIGRYTDVEPDFASTSTEGLGQSHENMPPYLVAYAWVRTA